MIPLAAPLDEIGFDGLIEVARGRLPALAPEWTDYNYSDPGITLVELLAWIADTQIYSIGRNRRDERVAMAALLGLSPHGAKPAAGLVSPKQDVPLRHRVDAGTRLIPAGASAPRLETAHAVTLWPVKLDRVISERPGGPVDLTAANAQARATFAPFVAHDGGDSTLRLVLAGRTDPGPVELAIGFEMEDGDGRTSAALGGIEIFQLVDGDEARAEIAVDTTAGLQRSGVAIVSLPVGGAGPHVLLIRRRHRAAVMPRLVRIVPNALPVVQRATLGERFAGTGRVGQTAAIDPVRLFPADEAAEGYAWRLVQAGEALAFALEVDGEQWRRTGDDFVRAGPDDPFYHLSERADGGRIELRFGNGINGRRPPPGADIAVRAEVSAGASGNVAGAMDWRLAGHGVGWENRRPVAGGSDAQDVAALLAALRRRLRSERTLATGGQILDAVRRLPAGFAVDRAWIEEGWEPGRRRPASPATRTLLVTRRGEAAGDNLGDTPWQKAIAHELRPRIALAERLIVATPRWRRLRVRVELAAVPGRAAATVAAAVERELARRLSPAGEKGAEWPLGRDVTGMAVGGWIRLLPEVATVTKVELLDEAGRPAMGNVIAVGRGELPLFVPREGDISVAAGRAS